MRTGYSISAMLCAAVMFMACGCLGPYADADFPAADPGHIRLVDEFDEFFDEFDETPEEGAAKKEKKPGGRRGRIEEEEETGERSGYEGDAEGGGASQWGVRGGGLFFISAEIREPDGGRLLIGGFRRMTAPRGFVEFGLDLGANTADPAEEELIIGRVNYLFVPVQTIPWFLELGVGAAYEIYNDITEEAAFIELGTGYAFRLAGKDLDARVAYWSILGSSNVDGLVLVSLGIGF